jgi:hypothetical protein
MIVPLYLYTPLTRHFQNQAEALGRAGLQGAQACRNTEPSPLSGLGMGLGWLESGPGLVYGSMIA